MASKYWIKLYIEILDDPKMGRLSDRGYRRTMELFLLAGENGSDGLLPTVEDLSWRLRLSPDELLMDLKELELAGILEPREEGWFVVNFSKRQAPVSDAKRMKQYRDRLRTEQYYGHKQSDDSVTERNVDTDTESETEEEGKSGGRLFDIYEKEIGLLTPVIAEEIGFWIDTYPESWIEDAIKEAAKNNIRKTSYVNGILKNWQTEGKGNSRKQEEELIELT